MSATADQLQAFRYLTADKADTYRLIVRIFLEAKESFALHLRPVDVLDRLTASADDLPALDREDLEPVLTALVGWGNLRADTDNAEVTSVEEFYRTRLLYQLTPAGEAAERAVRRFEDDLVRPGELQTAALADIREGLGELLVLLDAAATHPDGLDVAKAHRTMRELSGRFTELTDRAQVFIGNLQRTIDLQNLDLDAFVAYKDRLIDYLERFIGDLVLAQADIAARVQEVEARDLADLLDAVAARDLADVVEVDDDLTATTRRDWDLRWAGFRGWFVADERTRTAQADVLRARARSAIPALLRAVAEINRHRLSRTDRRADLRTLATWFATAATDDDAHRIWRAAFGLSPARHLQVDQTTLDARADTPVAATTSWLDADAIVVTPHLRRTGRHVRGGRRPAIIDRTAQKRLLAEKTAAERRQVEAARLGVLTNGTTTLSALAELDRGAFALLLDLLGEALRRPANRDARHVATTADGRLVIVCTPIPGAPLARIDTQDGWLTVPDHEVDIHDAIARAS